MKFLDVVKELQQYELNKGYIILVQSTKLLRSSNGTNVEERINIEYIENL